MNLLRWFFSNRFLLFTMRCPRCVASTPHPSRPREDPFSATIQQLVVAVGKAWSRISVLKGETCRGAEGREHAAGTTSGTSDATDAL